LEYEVELWRAEPQIDADKTDERSVEQ